MTVPRRSFEQVILRVWNLVKAHKTILAFRLPLLLALAVSVLSPDSLWAQGETTSAIVGSVSDPTGAAIAGAKVTITSTDNGLKRSVKTDECGTIQLPTAQARSVFGEGGGGPV